MAKTKLLTKAIEFAVKPHKNQFRKGTRIPYLVHLFNVSQILAEAECSDELMAAGLLHDVVEDTDVTIGEVKKKFGKHVAGIVEACTEEHKLKKKSSNANLTWLERKEGTIKGIENVTRDQLIVKLADKLDNMRAIRHDYEKIHDKLWERFNADKEMHQWYYGSIVKSALKNPNVDTACREIIDEIRREYEKVFPD